MVPAIGPAVIGIAISRRVPFPVGLRLAGRRVVVVGQSDAAGRRLELLAGTGADVVRAPCPPSDDDLRGAFLVLLCATDETVAAALDARARSGEFLLCCLDSERGFFEMPAVVRRGLLQVAISTSGAAPGLAARMRKAFERLLPEALGPFVDRLAALRESLAGATSEDRRARMMDAVAGVEVEGKLRLPE